MVNYVNYKTVAVQPMERV